MTEKTCPKCNKPLALKHRRSDNKPFYGCMGFPACRYTEDANSDASPNFKNVTPSPARNWSIYQQACFDFVTDGSGNAVVIAVAGSGKTTTLEHMIALVSPDLRLAFLAFNKGIARELQNRIAASPNRSISTLHSLGYSNIRAFNPVATLEEHKVDMIWRDITSTADAETFASLDEWRGDIQKVASLLRATLSPLTRDSVAYIADRYNVAASEDNLDFITEWATRLVEHCRATLDLVDFDDMIDFPATGIVAVSKTFDWVLVDEAQDLNKAQIALVLKSVATGGRVLAVGDPAQSIYGFRGADTSAIPNLIEALDAQTLPLSITYRCPASHVVLAKQFVPTLEARPNAPDGVLDSIPFSALVSIVQPGDLVMCRTNAPLVGPCFALIAAGIKATIQGRDIGSGLITLIDKVSRKAHANSLGDFLYALGEYRDQQVYKLTAAKKASLAATIDDQTETIIALAATATTIDDLVFRIQSVFDDNAIGVKFSSVHKAKGLEAERTFILRPDLLPHPMATSDWEVEQEMNIIYVALTRSKSEMYFVSQDGKAGINVAELFAASSSDSVAEFETRGE